MAANDEASLYKLYLNMLSKLPKNTKWLKFTFDANKCGTKFKIIENGMAAVKEATGDGSIQGI